MKKLLVVVVSLGLSCAAFSQSPTKSTTQVSTRSTTNKSYQAQDVLAQNGVAMKSGKMVIMKNGQPVGSLTKDMTMADGTSVTPSGLVTKSDGSTASLREGDYIMMSGASNKKLSWKAKPISPTKMKTDTLK
jgi:hypothetical protein